MVEDFDRKEFGQILHTIRSGFRYSLAQAAKRAGIDRQFIHRLENGKIVYPSYPYVTAYTTRTYPLTPNEVARIAGLWDPPDGEPEPHTQFSHASIAEASEYMQSLSQHDRHAFAALLLSVVEQHRRFRFELYNEDEMPPATDPELETLPSWLKDKLFGSR